MTWMDLKKKRRGGVYDDSEVYINYSRKQLMIMLAPHEEANCQIPNGRQTAQKTSQIKAIDR